MATHTITLTEAEELAMSICSPNTTSWIQEAVSGRASNSSKTTLPKLVTYCNANSIQLAVGEAAQLQQALDLGIVESGT
jgi:hypothetical protein